MGEDAPGWVKLDQEKYPRAVNRDGESFQMLSAFGKESMKADARAFRALMKHIRETDAGHQTVITVQIENQMGLFMTDRDYCEAANKAFSEPVPHTLDIWRAAAPSVDFLAPDIYVPIDIAKYSIEQYRRPGNPVFIPEFRHGDAGANFAFWAYGNHDAIAFAPFGIDDWEPEDDEITKVYSVIGQLSDLILQRQGKKSMTGIYLDTVSPVQKFELGGFRIEASLGGGYYAAFPDPAARSHRQTYAGGIIFSTGPDEFIVAGKNFRLTFVPVRPDPKRKFIDVEFMDEGTFVNGSWVSTRRLNGDEGTGGGDYGFGTGRSMTSGRLNFMPQPGDEYSIIRFKMYRYR